jgi:hypothetical protein
MTTAAISLNREATIRAVRPFLPEHRSEGEPVPLAALFDIARLRDAVTLPQDTTLYFEQSRQKSVERVRVVLLDRRQDPPVGVTRVYDLLEITAQPETAESVTRAIERLVARANELLPALGALKLGMDRVEQEIDYSDPKNLVTLLEDRDCTVLDPEAVARLVAEEPGPLYYGDIDLQEDGADWCNGGGPWANRMESKLVEFGAVRRLNE